jgi:hypothetical protein
MDATQLSAIRADFAALQRMIDHGYEPQLTVAVEHGTALADEVERLHTALAAAGDFMDPGTRRLWLAALRTDPEEDA